MKEIKDFIVSNETKFLNINETFNRFASLVRKEIRIVNNNTSESLFAKELELSDQRRDGYYMSIRLITRAYLVHPDSELKFAAQRIDKLLNKFGDIRHLAYDQETVLITKFCSEIASLKEETDKLNLGEWIDFLEKENIAFRYYQDDIEREQAITETVSRSNLSETRRMKYIMILFSE
ncbi:MAG: DUF6261 family protein [Dysgonomonas sp.]